MNYKFEVGMKVVVQGNHGARIGEVEHVTPTGRARVGGDTYRANGFQMGGSTWHSKSIRPATAEDIERIERAGAEERERVDLRHWLGKQVLTLPELRAIKAAVEAVREAGE